jgi:hypothetical protein
MGVEPDLVGAVFVIGVGAIFTVGDPDCALGCEPGCDPEGAPSSRFSETRPGMIGQNSVPPAPGLVHCICPELGTL